MTNILDYSTSIHRPVRLLVKTQIYNTRNSVQWTKRCMQEVLPLDCWDKYFHLEFESSQKLLGSFYIRPEGKDCKRYK